LRRNRPLRGCSQDRAVRSDARCSATRSIAREWPEAHLPPATHLAVGTSSPHPRSRRVAGLRPMLPIWHARTGGPPHLSVPPPPPPLPRRAAALRPMLPIGPPPTGGPRLLSAPPPPPRLRALPSSPSGSGGEAPAPAPGVARRGEAGAHRPCAPDPKGPA